jgi:hypothetical protein
LDSVVTVIPVATVEGIEAVAETAGSKLPAAGSLAMAAPLSRKAARRA